jgi:small ligand-binding sensory domain FIST
MGSFSGVGLGLEWRPALAQALEGRSGGPCDLAIVFASWHHLPAIGEVLAAVHADLAPRVLVGCSGQGVIGAGVEVEQQPALSVMALSLPGARLRTVRLRQDDLAGHGLEQLLAPDDATNAWLLLADPFTFDCDQFVARLDEAFPGVPVIGGMASARPGSRGTSLFHGHEALDAGALAVAVGGAWTLRSVVSQGAEPIGQPWTITGVDRNVIRSLGGRPPLEVLIETMRALPADIQQRASRNLLVGLAMDEYRDEFGRGDFLIRNLAGADQESGAIAIGALPRVGQTLQFQVRDAAAAHDELESMLVSASLDLHGRAAEGALLCSCNGRGAGLFGEPNHDAAALARQFGALPVAGFFCNGEIGPVGKRTFVHGFTASIGFFVLA